MKAALLLLVITVACSSKSTPATSGSASPAPDTKITTLTDGDVNSLGQTIIAAFAKPDSAAVYALALRGKDVPGMLETMKKHCPGKLKDADAEAATKEMVEMLGTDAEREATAKTIHADCTKLGDFSKATFTKATAREPKVECGIGAADRVIVEATLDGKPVFVNIDDPQYSPAGWKFPENIRCSSDPAAF